MSLGFDFLTDVRARFSLDSVGMSMTDWAVKHTTIKGRPFSVKGYEFQRAIMDDFHPNMDVIKCSQVGLTEVQIRKALGFAVRNQGRSLLFTLPDEKLYTKVSQTRFKPIIDDDKIFNQDRDQGATRSKEIKQFGRSFVYLTGCTEAEATSTSADAIFNDEVDLSPQDMLVLFNSRLQNSDLKISQRFSTPTFPGFGIDLGFQSSDQHLYLCKCSVCNHWDWPQFDRKFVHIPGLPDRVESLLDITQQMIDDSDDFSIADSYVVCPHCRSQLDLGNPELREWVPKHPKRSKDARGYAVSPFSTSRIDLPYILRQLLDYKRRNYLKGFCNTVLGQPYTDGSIRLEEDVIKACFDRSQSSVPDISSDTPVAVGIDMGLVCHVTVATLKGQVILFAAVPSAEIELYVQKLCAKYKVVAGGVDRFPYTPTAENIWRISGGKILPIEYRGQREINAIKDAYGSITHGQINRTMGLDRVANLIRSHHISFAGYGYYEQTIIDHLRDQYRDESPEKPAEWVKMTGQDHFHHSLAFLFMGIDLRELVMALEDEFVPSSLGWGIANMAQPKVQSLFSTPGKKGVAKSRDVIYQRH